MDQKNRTIVVGGKAQTKPHFILTSFSVLPKNQIVWIQSSSTADVCPLLTIVSHVEGDPTL